MRAHTAAYKRANAAQRCSSLCCTTGLLDAGEHLAGSFGPHLHGVWNEDADLSGVSKQVLVRNQKALDVKVGGRSKRHRQRQRAQLVQCGAGPGLMWGAALPIAPPATAHCTGRRCPAVAPQYQRRTATRAAPDAPQSASEPDDGRQVVGDWRAFRASLVAKESCAHRGARCREFYII